MLMAVVRDVSPSLARCELTHVRRRSLDVHRAVWQHRCYARLLEDLGLRVVSLAAEPDLPDAAFVEDPAVVVDELAVIGRMGTPSRAREVSSVAALLSDYRPIHFAQEPATLEGGDVMRIGRTLYVGRTTRTNDAGIEQLERCLAPHGYRVVPVDVRGCLHLKSGCSWAGEDTVLANPHWVATEALAGLDVVPVHPREPHAANALAVAGVVVMPESFPRTRERLEERGLEVRTVDVSELQKAEAGVSCLSLVFRVGRSSGG